MSPATCTASDSPNNCGHHIVTVGGIALHLHESEIGPLSGEELETLLRLAVRHRGVALAQLLNRVVIGDEATNVKVYGFFGPGAAIAKTNIGTSYVDVPPGANGQRVLVDFTGCTEFRPVLTANLVGSGPFGVRIVKDDDSAVLFENASIGVTGERELDPGWQPIPEGFAGLELLRMQAKSATAQDDPVFRRGCLLVR